MASDPHLAQQDRGGAVSDVQDLHLIQGQGRQDHPAADRGTAVSIMCDAATQMCVFSRANIPSGGRGCMPCEAAAGRAPGIGRRGPCGRDALDLAEHTAAGQIPGGIDGVHLLDDVSGGCAYRSTSRHQCPLTFICSCCRACCTLAHMHARGHSMWGRMRSASATRRLQRAHATPPAGLLASIIHMLPLPAEK